MTDTCTVKTNGSPDEDSNAFAPGPGKHVLFFGDPMCSWCWGFAPELQKIVEHCQGRAQFEMVMGGLRPGTTDPWDQSMQSYIRHHWQEVEAKTGQPFDFARFDDADFIYDTEPGCRALIAVRTIAPEKSLAMYEALQRGFYAQNLNITDTNVLADLAADIGIKRDLFIDTFSHQDMRRQVSLDFQRSQAFGVQGFPAVMCADDGQYGFLTLGYRTFDALQGNLEDWLNA